MDTPPKLRLFVDAALAPGAALPLTAEQAHYLLSVMRAAAGTPVAVFNGRDGEWRARLEPAGRKGGRLILESPSRPQAPEPDLWLLFAPIKRTRIDFIAEKATELGVSALQRVFTRHTVMSRVNDERLRAIAIEAAEQCERLAVPTIMAPLTLPALMAKWPENRQLFVADERRTAPVLRHTAAACALLVGPEGGFTDAELVSIDTHPQVKRVSLGAHILRAETAAIAGLALLLATDPPQE